MSDVEDLIEPAAKAAPESAPATAAQTETAPVSAPTDAAPLAPGPSQGRSIDEVFKPRAQRNIDDVFKPRHEAPTDAAGALQQLGEDQNYMPQSFDPEEWADYLAKTPVGQAVTTFGDAFKGPGAVDGLVDWMKQYGMAKDLADKTSEQDRTFGQALARPAIAAAQDINQALLSVPVGAFDFLSRTVAGVLSVAEEAGVPREILQAAETELNYGHVIPGGGVHVPEGYQTFTEARAAQRAAAREMPIEPAAAPTPTSPITAMRAEAWGQARLGQIEAKAEGRGEVKVGPAYVVAGEPAELLTPTEKIERAFLRANPHGEDILRVYPSLAERFDRRPPLPEYIARARAGAVIGEGEAGYMGTGQTTEADVAARAKAAGDAPAPAYDRAGAPPVEAEAPPTPDAIARKIEPELFREYDELQTRKDTLSGWLRELPEKTRANIEANPPAVLRDLDAEIVKLQKKVDNAGNRRRAEFEEAMEALHDRRDDLLADLVRSHPDVARVRSQLQQTDYRMRDLSPQVSAAYRRARDMVPETPPEAAGAPEIASPAREAAPGAPEGAVEVEKAATEASAVEPAKAEPAAPGTPEFVAEAVPREVSSAAQIQTITDDVVRQLTAAGRPLEESQAGAAIVAARYEALAKWFDGKLGSAEDLYRKYGAQIRSAMQREPRVRKAAANRAREFAQMSKPEIVAHMRRIKERNDRARVRALESAKRMQEFKDEMAAIHQRTLDKLKKIREESDARWEERARQRKAEEAEFDRRWKTDPEFRAEQVRKNEAYFEDLRRKAEARAKKEWKPTKVDESSKPEEMDDSGAWPIDGNGFVVSDKGTPIKFGNQKDAGRWILDHGNKESEGQTFEIANHPSGDGFTVWERTRDDAEDAAREFAQSDDYSFEQTKKGSITFAPRDGAAMVKLFKDADASTFMHETGHQFLEQILTFGDHPDAPAQLKADAETVRKWLGVESGKPIPTKAHETFARGWERYLMEGRAPTKALADVFAKFAKWLTDIYRTVAKLRSPINDDIRDVFDRLLTKTPERATITPELPLESGLADAHEGLMRNVKGRKESEDHAHRMAGETAEEARAKAAEIINELRLRRGESTGAVGGGEPQRTDAGGGGAPAGDVAPADGNVPQPGAQLPGGSGLAPTGFGPPEPAGGVAKPARPAALYERVPKRPPSLADWIKAKGGVQDHNGEVSALGGKKKPGMIKPGGKRIDDVIQDAWDSGFFPESEERPTVREFLDKLENDLRGVYQWSEHDADAVAEYQAKVGHNADVDQIAAELEIETKGLNYGEFWDKVADRKSQADQAKFIAEKADAHVESLADADKAAKEFLESRGDAWEPDAIVGGKARTLEDLENERRSEEAARGLVSGPGDGGGFEPARANQGPVQNGGGPGGLGAVDAGGPTAGGESAAVAPARPAAGEGQGAEGAEARGAAAGPAAPGGEPARGEGVPDTAAAEQPELERAGRLDDGTADAAATKLGKAGFNPDAAWAVDKDGKDLAGNIRLENLNTSEDVNDLLRAWARGRNDLLEARHNEESYRGQIEVEAARALFCDVAASTRAAERKFAESGSLADATELMQWRERLDLVGDKVSTLAAGAGRTLAAFRKMKSQIEIQKRLEGRTLFQLRAEAALNATLETPAQLGRAARRQLMTPFERAKDQGRSMLIEYYVNNLISGPITHAAYMVGNATTAVIKAAIELPLSAGYRAVREAVTGRPVEGVHLDEAKAMWLSLGKGFRDGFPAAWKATKSGAPGILEGENGAQSSFFAPGIGVHEIPGTLGTVLNAPSHVVTGIHTLSRTVNYQMEKAALIAHQASKEGLTGEAYNRRVAQLDQNPTQEIMDKAAEEATHMVMMDRAKWGTLTSKISGLSNAFLPLKLALPFVQVGANLLHGALVERTVVGLFEKNIRDNLMGKNGARARDVQAGKIATGTAIAVGIYAMAADGLITGGEPKNPQEAALWRLSGKQAYSIRAGGSWVPYRKWLGWYGPLVAMAANVHEVGQVMDDKGLTAAATAAVFGFSEVVNDESWFRGMSEFVDAVKHWDTDGERYLRNFGTNFIPFSVGLSQVAHLVDPYMRHADGFIEQAQRKMPVLSESLRVNRDIFGQPLPSHMQITPTQINDDPVIKAMMDVDVWPRAVDDKIRGVKLTPAQADEYAKYSGSLLKQYLDAFVGEPTFSQLPGSIRREQIKKLITHAREQARNLIAVNSRGTDNDILAKAADARVKEKADYDER